MLESPKQSKKKSSRRSPTLDTILMVENTLKNTADSPITLAELKRRLPRKVMHQTVQTIVDYLLMSNKIIIGAEGILWIYKEPEVLKELLRDSVEI